MKKHIHCPTLDFTCPYYKEGICTMYPQYNPVAECDAWCDVWYDDSWTISDFVCTCEECEVP